MQVSPALICCQPPGLLDGIRDMGEQMINNYEDDVRSTRRVTSPLQLARHHRRLRSNRSFLLSLQAGVNEAGGTPLHRKLSPVEGRH